MHLLLECKFDDRFSFVVLLFDSNKPLQNQIYHQIYIPSANAYVEAYFSDPQNTEEEKARFRSASFNHAGKWLMAHPRKGFWMSSEEFRIAMKLRLGMKLPANGIKCACGQASADDELHILNCHLGNQIIHRHNAVVQVFMDLLQSAGQTATSEERVQKLAHSDQTSRSNVTII